MTEKNLVVEFDKKFKKALSKVETVMKNKKAFNFSYADVNDVTKSVFEAIDKAGLMYISISWRPLNPNTYEVAKYTYTDKQVIIEGSGIIKLRDMETGYEQEWVVPLGGKGNDSGMAKGAAETYSTRHWMLKAFGVEVERTEVDITQQEYIKVGDELVPCLTNEQISEYAQFLKDRFKIGPESVTSKSNEVLIKFNEYKKTNYQKVQQVPSGETFDELKKFAIALSNERPNI